MSYNSYRFGFGNRLTPVVKNLLIINGLFLLADYAFKMAAKIEISDYLALTYIQGSNFKFYQIITHMFVHSGPNHLFSNMLSLWLFGTWLEEHWGAKRFIFFYFFTGIGAAILHQMVTWVEIERLYAAVDDFAKDPSNGALSDIINKFSIQEQFKPTFYNSLVSNYNNDWVGITSELMGWIEKVEKNRSSVGASGAVFGLLIAFGMYNANREIRLLFPPIPMKVKYMVAGYAIMELYLGIQNNPADNVAHFAHLGGALFGFILVKYWNKNNRKSFY
jgi:membrane associated rhomboid family serine protease